MDGPVFVYVESVYGVYVMNFARGIRLVIATLSRYYRPAFCGVHTYDIECLIHRWKVNVFFVRGKGQMSHFFTPIGA